VLTSTALTWNGNTLFTAATDGASSGLDADLLDGVQGAGYAQLTSANVFTANQRISSATPQFFLNETDGATNNRLWVFVAESEQLRFGAENDISTITTNWLTVDRTGTTVDAIALASTALTWNGAAIVTTGTSPTFTGDHVSVTNTDVYYELNETDAASNEKVWWLRAAGGQFLLQTRTDALSAGALPIAIDRTGTTVDAIALAATELKWNGNTLFTTANDGTGSGLDADLLDGVHLAALPQLASANTFTQPQAVSHATNPYFAVNCAGTVSYFEAISGVARVYSAASTAAALFSNAGAHNLTLSSAGALTWDGNTLFTTANDGTGSGLDADLLDGIQSSSFARVDSASTFTANPVFSNTSPGFRFNETDASSANKSWYFDANGEQLRFYTETDAGAFGASWLTVDRTGTTVDAIALVSTALTWNGNTLFTTANDGSGSGLDADLLDGVQGANYLQTSGLLTAVLAVDGSGSGLDADLLDGVQGAGYAQTSSGSFTGTLTGMSGATSGTVSYRIAGGICTLFGPGGGITGTSNSNGMSMTGLAGPVTPAATRQLTTAAVQDNGVSVSCEVQVSSGGVITFRPIKAAGAFYSPDSAGFTTSGTKGIITG
jgi:hypothetical protein